VRFERAAQLKRNVYVARTDHSFVKLIEQQQISESKNGMSVQGLDDAFEMGAALDVPLDNSEKGFRAWTRSPKLVHSRLVEPPPKLSLVLAIKLRAAQFIEPSKAAKLSDNVVSFAKW
jgi:hypothetical protein